MWGKEIADKSAEQYRVLYNSVTTNDTELRKQKHDCNIGFR